MSKITVSRATSQDDIIAAKALFQAYADSLEYSIEYQGFSDEMARFPEGYDLILVATSGDTTVGTVGLKSHKGSKTLCEMKRMFVTPDARGLGAGRILADVLMTEAKAHGYKVMLLDTLKRWKAAHALYISIGFEEAEPFEHFPQPDVIYLKRHL